MKSNSNEVLKDLIKEIEKVLSETQDTGIRTGIVIAESIIEKHIEGVDEK